MKIKISCIACLLLCIIIFENCKKEKAAPVGSMSEVVIDSITDVFYNFANVRSKVTSDGGTPVTEKGVCWSTNAGPTTAQSKTSDGTGTGMYTSMMTGLLEKTIYHLRSYSVNSNGTAYGDEVSFTTPVKPDIQTQWMLSNLDVVTYSNGDTIPEVKDETEWKNLTTGAWCYYDNDSANGLVYGKLYNWYAVNDPRGLAPVGWHIPSKEEWSGLVNIYGGDDFAGGKLKTTDLWESPNTGATNETGFSGKPTGYRGEDGTFSFLGKNTFYWTTKEHDTNTAVERCLGFDYADCFMFYYDKNHGMSVRCVKN